MCELKRGEAERRAALRYAEAHLTVATSALRLWNDERTSSGLALILCVSSGQISEFSLKEQGWLNVRLGQTRGENERHEQVTGDCGKEKNLCSRNNDL